MSENDVWTIWCLIDGEERPFHLKANRNWEIAELADSILERRRDLCAGINDIFLWKVTKPTSVDPETDFRDRFPCPILDFSDKSIVIRLNSRTLSVSDVFHELAKGQLHIVVEVRKPVLEGPPLKKAKLAEALDSFRHFHNYYWGENRIKLQTEGGQTYSILDLTSPTADLPELNYRSVKTLIIRNEYQLAYDAIVKAITEMDPESRVVFIFTGQPGTGKTLFLFVLLVLGLQHKRAVALQINADEVVLFNEEGVSKHGQHDSFAIPKGAWTLSDSQSHGPCTAFRFSKGHLIYASSPASGRWKEWSKQFGAQEYVMDIWSMSEFRTLLTVSNFDISAGESLFLKYGSNIRRIIDILKDPEMEAAYIDDVERGATTGCSDHPDRISL